MFSIFFKTKRRIILFSRKLYCRFLLLQWRQLYPDRFTLKGNLSFGKDFCLFFDATDSSIEIGDDVLFRDYCQLRSVMNGKLKIGERVFFNNFCSIICGGETIIGNDCQFGEGVKFYDHNHQYTSGENINNQGYKTGKIKIGNNCWFGSGVIILRNVEIGDNVVIGAGCIIHQSIPSNSVVKKEQELLVTSYK